MKIILIPIILCTYFQVSSQILIDIDGNTYETVTIGTQTWTAENLKTTKFSNGVPISYVHEDSTWSKLSTSAFCTYEHDISNREEHGNLYNFYSVISKNQLCPIGWYVPTSQDWTTLIDYLGGDTIAGGKLKEFGFDHWRSPNTGADNSTEMKVIPSGYRYSDYGFHKGEFNGLNGNGSIWTSTSSSDSTSLAKYFYAGSAEIGHLDHKNSYGRSVRCIKDDKCLPTINFDEESVILYPNPTSGVFQIQLADEFSDDLFNVYIYNNLGQKIREIKNDCLIDLSNEPKQIFLVIIATRSKIFEKRISVQ